jgi:hypothetical protein
MDTDAVRLLALREPRGRLTVARGQHRRDALILFAVALELPFACHGRGSRGLLKPARTGERDRTAGHPRRFACLVYHASIEELMGMRGSGRRRMESDESADLEDHLHYAEIALRTRRRPTITYEAAQAPLMSSPRA